MLIVMGRDAEQADIDRVCGIIESLGFEARPIPGGQRTAVGIVGNQGAVDPGRFIGLPGVAEAIPVSAPYKIVSREWRSEDTVIRLKNGTAIGGGSVVIMGGPCSVETEEQIFASAAAVAHGGGTVLRGGAFKPRTSPYAFQGLGEAGLKMMRAAADEHGLAVVTEAVDHASAELVAKYADLVQIGARNMQNYSLLSAIGGLEIPVVLKRGMSATVKEWLLAAEYVMSAGNERVVLCERGIRSFDSSTRNVMDLAAVAVAKAHTHLPVIADPSHGTGRRQYVTALAKAAVAVGADGLIVEMHPKPEEALSDGAQSLYPEQFKAMVEDVVRVAGAVRRKVSGAG